MLTTLLRSGSGDGAAPSGDRYLVDVAARLARQSEHERSGFLHRLSLQAPQMAADLRAVLDRGKRGVAAADAGGGGGRRQAATVATRRSPREDVRGPAAVASVLVERAAAMRRARGAVGPTPTRPAVGPTMPESVGAVFAQRAEMMRRARATRSGAMRAAGVPTPWET